MNIWTINSNIQYLILIILTVIILLPIIWALSTSLKPTADIYEYPPRWIPKIATLESYRFFLTSADFLRYFFNSFLVGICVTVITLFVGSIASYHIARFSFPGKNMIFFIFIASIMIPGVTNLIPLYITFNKIHLIDTYFSLIIVYIGWFIPFTVWMMRGFIQTRHVLLHPITLISAWGVKRYLRILVKCFDHSNHCFTDFFCL